VSTFDLLIRAAPGENDIGVSDGLIAAVGPELDGGGAEEIDALALSVLPGVVDAHVHLNEPGRTEWEGFSTGTAALAAGGATTAVDMPLNAHPPTLDGAAFDAKRACGELLSEGRLSDETIRAVFAPFPAERLRLGGKGRLEPGADADFVLVDRTGSRTLTADELRQRHRISPFLGRTLAARVVRTILRGRTVFVDGRLTGEPAGRLITPTARMP
jgi:dihydroorotase-like cyclic amidohydrolase